MVTNHLTRRLAAVAHDFGQPAMIGQAVAFLGSLAARVARRAFSRPDRRAPPARAGRAVGLRDARRRDVARLGARGAADARSLDANVRGVLARVGRTLLIFAAVLIGLSLVGIGVTVLGVFGVFGGALRVGLGIGLQKIASNYVSGFIILLDRSLRLGDAIDAGGLQGVVTPIRTRYTACAALTATRR